MKTKLFRIGLSMAAILLGTGIVTALTAVSEKSRGPIEQVLVKASDVVHQVEEEVIIAKLEHKRSEKLSWLKPFDKNPASLKNPKMLLLGAYDNQTAESFESIVSLEDTLKNTFPLIQIYSAWGNKTEEQFPKLQVESIIELGSIPVITWEPWLTDFDAAKNPSLRATNERDKGGLADIAKGQYDDYIKTWAASAKAVKHTLFLRVGHEMNDPYRYPWGPQNNSANDFIAAWKHIHDVFAQVGAANVIWIWSPHPAYGYFDAFYPGDAYVDYVGVSALNYGTVASWSKWWSFGNILGKHYDELAHFKKPIMITEFGCLAIGGNRSDWFKDALTDLPIKYPAVKALLFFHYSDDQTTTQQPINWYFKNDKASVNTVINALQKWPDASKPVVKN